MADPGTSERLWTDEPIQGRAEDVLSRGRLVDAVARHIRYSRSEEGVVLALNAPWGAGKSSFLNLLEEALLSDEAVDPAGIGARKPIVVHFNPWHYTNVEQLVRMFFKELERGIGTAGYAEAAQAAGRLLQGIGALVSIANSGLGAAVDKAGTAIGGEKGLPEFKSELDKLLAGLGQRIVVFVDDLDRLERDMLRMIFRVIRLNAGFSNVTYVLAFDRKVVEASLDEENGIRGRDYLEKIIQVSFDIPPPEPVVLSNLLFAELNAVTDLVETRALDQTRWGNLFHSGFREHFKTIRQIKRYGNGLRLTLPPVALEVDLSDFLGIELLRTFHPEVYRTLAQEGKEMVAPESPGRESEVSTEALQKWAEALADKAAPDYRDAVLQVLRRLFPELARVYQNTSHGSSHIPVWRRDGRVCSHEVFDKFFLLGTPSGDISEAELRGFVNSLATPDVAQQQLQRMITSGTARRLLERLSDVIPDLPPQQARALIELLLLEGENLRFESRGFLDFTGEMSVSWAINQALACLESEEERVAVLLAQLATTGLYTFVHEVSYYDPRHRDAREEVLIGDQEWERLRNAAVLRLQEADVSGELWRDRKAVWMLFRWREWASEDAVQDRVEAFVADDTNMIVFLKAFIARARSMSDGDRVSRVHEELNTRDLAFFLPLAKVEQRLQEMKGDLQTDAQTILGMMNRTRR